MNNMLAHQFSLQNPSKLLTITFHLGPDPIYLNRVALIKTAPASVGANLQNKVCKIIQDQVNSRNSVPKISMNIIFEKIKSPFIILRFEESIRDQYSTHKQKCVTGHVSTIY